MKKLIVTCSLLAFASVASFAQVAKQPGTTTPSTARPQMTPEQMKQREDQAADRQSEFFKKQYSLNDEQTKGVRAACATFVKSMNAMRAEGKQPNKQDMDKLMAERDASFKKAMTPEQYAKYEATRTKPTNQNSAQQMQQNQQMQQTQQAQRNMQQQTPVKK